jgi:hypothetical protein
MAAPVKRSPRATTSDEWFDRLARGAARSMSRRDAVGFFAGTTAIAVLGSWVRPSRTLNASTVNGSDPGCAGTRSFYRAGCPKPVPKLPPYRPAVNGCGPQNGFNPVPQAPLYLADFSPACDGHDRGYGTCNRPKEDTDKKFLEDMKAICAGSGTPLTGFVDWVLMLQCHRNAEIFYTAVSNLGDDPWKEGQAEGCDCCEECAPLRQAPVPPCPSTCPGANKSCCVAIKYGYHHGGCCSPVQECCIGPNQDREHPNQMSWCCPRGRCGASGGICLKTPCLAG